MTFSPSLDSLPVELQCSIIRLLDPIALISISQTNARFRDVVRPRKTHFGERLLALECLEEIGGPQIDFSRFGTVKPDRNSPEWEAGRWACTSCLKLLPHYAFTNQSLSRLCYRKPVRGSPAARKCTSWEPAPSRGTLGTKDPRGSACMKRSEQQRRRYGATATGDLRERRRPYMGPDSPETRLWNRLSYFQECGMEEFENMTFAEFENLSITEERLIFDREAYAAALVCSGTSRHARRCIECRFRAGGFRGCTGNGRGIGTPSVPIIPGRQESFGTVVDRYFPGISDVLDTKRPAFNAPVFVIYRQNAVDRPWTLYRVRCPGCSQWKEMRAFRYGGIYPRWQPVDNTNTQTFPDQHHNWDCKDVTDDSLNKMQCNYCFAKDHSRKALGEILIDWLDTLIDAQLGELTGSLLRGFGQLVPNMRYFPKSQKGALKAILTDIRPLLNKEHTRVTRTDVALIRQKRAEYLAMEPEIDYTNMPGRWFGNDWYLDQWVHNFDESEALWYWLKGCKEEILEEGKADVLVGWVLNRDERIHS
ncbi:hypothetical protein BDV12DRAFT_177835 [Aspergillus spectabilis]